MKDKFKILAVAYTPISDKTTWPAVRLAASRKASVSGRTIILIDSISTNKGFSHPGAPPGKILARVSKGL